MTQKFATPALLLAALCLAGCGASSVPTPITATTAPSQPVPPLGTWTTSLSACKTQVVNVVIFGDSRSIADTTVFNPTPGIADTFGQKWTDLLAQQLQTRCGSHGTGLVPFLPRAGEGKVNADFYTLNGTFTTDAAIGPTQGRNLPSAMTLVATSTTTIALSTATAFDHLNAYCVHGPGLNTWTMSVDGIPVGNCGGSATNLSPTLAASSAVPLGLHSANLICTVAPCEAYGLEAVAGLTGVSVHNLSVGSCTAECFGVSPTTQLAFSDLNPGDQQLVILNLITNEPGVGYSTSSFQQSLENLITHARSLPGKPSVLLVSPLQDMIAGQSPYYPIIYSTSQQDATAFFDMRTQYGDAFVPSLFGPDKDHENNAGHLAVYTTAATTLLP
jgi:hypothetical protein